MLDYVLGQAVARIFKHSRPWFSRPVSSWFRGHPANAATARRERIDGSRSAAIAAVCTKNSTRVDDVMESPKLAE